MKLSVQKRLAADIMKCSPKRVQFDSARLDEIKEAITKSDLRGLVKDEAIVKKPTNSTSRVRARKHQQQRAKGKQRGQGRRKGTKKARNPKKATWMAKIRAQRTLLKELREKALIKKELFRMLYMKAKGGFFRSKRHIRLYLEEHNMIKK